MVEAMLSEPKCGTNGECAEGVGFRSAKQVSKARKSNHWTRRCAFRRSSDQ